MTHALLRSCVDRNKIRTQNRSQSPPQISILVTLGYNGSHWSQQRPGGELCYISFCCPDPISSPVCEADQNEHLCTTLCLLTRSRMAATTGTQWRGKNLSAKSFQQLYPNQKLKMCPPPLEMDPSFQVFCSLCVHSIPHYLLYSLRFSLTTLNQKLG